MNGGVALCTYYHLFFFVYAGLFFCSVDSVVRLRIGHSRRVVGRLASMDRIFFLCAFLGLEMSLDVFRPGDFA
jgi:hypothetical protein